MQLNQHGIWPVHPVWPVGIWPVHPVWPVFIWPLHTVWPVHTVEPAWHLTSTPSLTSRYLTSTYSLTSSYLTITLILTSMVFDQYAQFDQHGIPNFVLITASMKKFRPIFDGFDQYSTGESDNGFWLVNYTRNSIKDFDYIFWPFLGLTPFWPSVYDCF